MPVINDPFFTISYRDKKSQARLGRIITPHGEISTPAFIPVGSQGGVKSLTPDELETLLIEAFFVNTYHIYLRPGVEVIKRFGGLRKFIGWKKTLFTDSGGYQLFSLGKKGKRSTLKPEGDKQASTVKIDDEAVIFKSHWDGSIHRLTAERAIDLQRVFGADIILVFDDCTPYPVTYLEARQSVKRTHKWAIRCQRRYQDTSRQSRHYQALYGIVQGSVFEDLRKESAKFIASLPFAGIAIGGVSVGESKKQMYQVCDWVVPLLPEAKPRHLLGVGEIDDIFNIIERGIDTFDCVMPTRLARMGHVLRNSKFKIQNSKLQKWAIDITKKQYAVDKRPLDSKCACYACNHFSRAYVHHLFRVRELLAYRLVTIHNLFFIQSLLKEIRQAIRKDQLLELKRKWLYNRSCG